VTTDRDKAFVEAVRTRLDSHADSLDELTSARLHRARARALQQAPRRSLTRFTAAAAAAAAVVALALVVLMQPLDAPDVGGAMWVAQEDIELIEELEFYAWLEATQPSS
jgi:hypothetical protein